MPRIVFTPSEKARIEELLEELDPARHELTRHYAERLPPRDWEFVLAYLRRELRSFLEIDAMVRAMAETAVARGIAAEDGAADFLASRAWVRNFDLADETDDLFMAIAATTDRPTPTSIYDLAADADTLLELAEARSRTTLDDELREMLRQMNP